MQLTLVNCVEAKMLSNRSLSTLSSARGQQESSWIPQTTPGGLGRGLAQRLDRLPPRAPRT